jgi:hypothetical protein
MDYAGLSGVGVSKVRSVCVTNAASDFPSLVLTGLQGGGLKVGTLTVGRYSHRLGFLFYAIGWRFVVQECVMCRE